MADETELTDSVNDAAGKDLRTNSPDLFGDTPSEDDAKPIDPEFTLEDLEAIASDDDDERDDKGRFVPRSRVDELTAQRNAERDARAAAEARATALEEAQAEQARAAQEAADKLAAQRDFDAERDALQEKYDANELDLADFRKQTRVIDKEQREFDKRMAVAEAIYLIDKRNTEAEQRQHEQTVQRASADLKEAAERFLAESDNAVYKDDQFRIAAFNVAKEEIWIERNGNIAWDDLLTQAKERVEEHFAPVDKASAAVDKTLRERREKAAKAASEVTAIPARPNGGMGSRALANRDEDNMEMSRVEWSKLPQAERDRILGKTA